MVILHFLSPKFRLQSKGKEGISSKGVRYDKRPKMKNDGLKAVLFIIFGYSLYVGVG